MSTLRLLIKPAIFTAGVCGTCFCASAIVQSERQRRSPYNVPTFTWRRNVLDQSQFGAPDWSWRQQQQSSWIGKLTEWRRRVYAWKNSLSTGEKLAFGTIAINLAVMGAWRLPALVPVMSKYFLSNSSPSKLALSPMILSCFSHTMPLHFAFNMYALYSFSNIATIFLGPEQLVGMFISAGTVSSLASIAHRLVTKRWTPSLGASGAILGVVAYVCIKQPDSSLLLFFIPVAAGNAVKAIIAFDTLGLLARWSFIDHAAHLGGTLFGVWYALNGEQLYHKHRRSIAEKWIRLKTKYED